MTENMNSPKFKKSQNENLPAVISTKSKNTATFAKIGNVGSRNNHILAKKQV